MILLLPMLKVLWLSCMCTVSRSFITVGAGEGGAGALSVPERERLLKPYAGVRVAVDDVVKEGSSKKRKKYI